MYSILQKFLFSLEPETSHWMVKNFGKVIPKGYLSRSTAVKSGSLKTSIGDVEIESPIGLAAGFDKNGEMLSLMHALGFGYLEIGSVTALPCEGSPKPRIFRLPEDQSLINRMGLPNWGVEKIRKHLLKHQKGIPLGINIAKTPDFVQHSRGKKIEKGIDDYVESFSKIHDIGAYLVLNLSCPNTKDGRTFEEPVFFEDLAREIAYVRQSLQINKPVLVKFSPDLEKMPLYQIVDSAMKHGFDGFVLSNTTPGRERLKTAGQRIEKIGKGGLSGKGLLYKANKQLKNVFKIIGRDKILMGVGGILSFDDLLLKLSYGAQFFQVYTGLVYNGPYFIRELNKKLASLCRKHKVKDYRELVGSSEILKGRTDLEEWMYEG